MIQPPALQPGDTIGLVATARKMSEEELQPAIKTLADWGFKVKKAPHLTGSFHQFSGTDEERLADLQEFIDSPEVKAILCVRGGYGTVRLMDEVDFSPLQMQPKWIGGYSDVTVLLNQLGRLGVESLHCSMPINFKTNTPMALQSLRQALSGEKLSYAVNAHPFNRKGTAQGPLTGGNLSMLYSQLGSPTSLSTAGSILFMEDLDEYLYHIDRMMYNLKRNGYLEKPAGVIVGGMGDMNDNIIPFGFSAEETIRQHLEKFSYPVCFGFPAGHLDDNRTLIFGRKATLKVSDETILEFDEHD